MIDNEEISLLYMLENILYLRSLLLDRIENLRQPRDRDNIPCAW